MDSTLMELIEHTQAGDQAAFEALFESYKNLVYKTAYLMLYDSDEADEVLQEVFLKVYRSLSSYQPARGAFTTWLYRITTNHCLNRHRRKRFSLVPLEWEGRENRRLPYALETGLGEDPDLQRALGSLSDKLRAVIVLRYYGDLSYAEIAESLQIPVGTVKSRLDLALRTLRRDLEDTKTDLNNRQDQG